MIERRYISPIARQWPRERQIELLGTEGPLYEDKVRPARLRKRDPADLIQRAVMLAVTTRKNNVETIRVAAPECLAHDAEDFGRVLAAAAKRNATVLLVNSGLAIPPNAPADVVALAIEQIGSGRRRSNSAPGGKLGRVIAAEKKRADSKVRAMRIADRWPLPNAAHPTAALLAEAGRTKRKEVVPMSYNLACQHLGKRPLAQKRYQQKLDRAAKKDQTDAK